MFENCSSPSSPLKGDLLQLNNFLSIDFAIALIMQKQLITKLEWVILVLQFSMNAQIR